MEGDGQVVRAQGGVPWGASLVQAATIASDGLIHHVRAVGGQGAAGSIARHKLRHVVREEALQLAGREALRKHPARVVDAPRKIVQTMRHGAVHSELCNGIASL